MRDVPAAPKDAPAPAATGPMRGGEIVFLLAWPWFLAGVLAVAATGSSGGARGGAAAALLAAGVAFLAVVGAPLLAGTLRPAPAERAAGTPGSARAARTSAARSGMTAALAGTLAVPALLGSVLASPVPSGTVVCGTVVTALAAYALARAVAVLGRWYPLAATLWLGGPPLLYFVLIDVLGRRAEWLLALGPASGAAWMVGGAESAWGRFAAPAFVIALAGGALSFLDPAADPSRRGTNRSDDPGP